MDRAQLGGLDDVGIGALFGLAGEAAREGGREEGREERVIDVDFISTVFFSFFMMSSLTFCHCFFFRSWPSPGSLQITASKLWGC